MKRLFITVFISIWSISAFAQNISQKKPTNNIGKSLHGLILDVDTLNKIVDDERCSDKDRRAIKMYLNQIMQYSQNLYNYAIEKEAHTEYVLHIELHRENLFSLRLSDHSIQSLVDIVEDLKAKLGFADDNKKEPFKKVLVNFYVINPSSKIPEKDCFIVHQKVNSQISTAISNDVTKSDGPLILEMYPGSYIGWAKKPSRLEHQKRTFSVDGSPSNKTVRFELIPYLQN